LRKTKSQSYNAERGREKIKKYLGIRGFVSPYVILVDGVEWVVYGPSVEGPKIEPGRAATSSSLLRLPDETTLTIYGIT